MEHECLIAMYMANLIHDSLALGLEGSETD